MDVFTFDSRYAGYPDSVQLQLETVRDSLWSRGILRLFLMIAIFVILLLFGGIGLAPAIAESQKQSPNSMLIGLCIISLGVIWGFRRDRREALRRYRQLTNSDRVKILQGRIIDWRVQHYYRQPEPTYRTFVYYTFTTPIGTTIQGMQSRREIIEVPPAGTPVRVLYADDDTYVML